MPTIRVLSLTSVVKEWSINSHYPRVLHIFDHACNLINENRDVLSIVTPEIGNGPFNLVVEDVCFSEQLTPESAVLISPAKITLDDITINTTGAKLWNPRPDWEMLHSRLGEILDRLSKLQITRYQMRDLPPGGSRDMPAATNTQTYSTTVLPRSLISSLAWSLVKSDIPSALIVTSQLAGLGIGLTPAGDDFILGALLAAWLIHPAEVAKLLAEEVANLAAPLTTSLSAAWLRSAGRGEAGILWHEFFNSLIAGDTTDIQSATTKILAVGETSGADAFAGFIGAIRGVGGIRRL